jgi:uncharacterized membrane protein
MKIPHDRLVLRKLPLPTRLVIAAFLVSVSIGYFSALIQLHFQHAKPGKALPEADDAVAVFHGQSGMSQLERLLVTDNGKPFNGSGSMRQAFTSKSAGWKGAVKQRAQEKSIGLPQAEQDLRIERDGERLALLEWLHAGVERQPFEDNGFVGSANLANHPISSEFIDNGPDGVRRVKIASIISDRCARCHSDSASSAASKFPLETWEQIHEYCEVGTNSNGMSMKKLAQTTHVHLLGFAMLYGLTGLAFSLTTYPGWIRASLGILPLAAQVVDISFWWLARMDPVYAHGIVVTGSIVAGSLFLQVSLSLMNMFGKGGKLVLVLALIAGAAGMYVIKEQVIDPYLAREELTATVGD